MKKKLLFVSLMVAVLACLFAISVFAENNIIKLDTLPTLEEIHANPEAYVSHLDAFDGNSYGELDSQSVVVLSDLAETPTYYVYPAYYYIQSTSYTVYDHLPTLNSAIAAADSTAFAGYSAIDSNYARGGCKYLIRIEVPTYVTTIAAKAKFEGSSNLKEIYFPIHEVTDPETGITRTTTYITSVSGENLLSSCSSVEYIHNMGYLPVGIIQGNKDGFVGCNALKEVTIPEGVTSIPAYFFKNCNALKEIILPNSVVKVGKQAFAYCTSLETVSFGAGFTTFVRANNDYETFMGCNNLKYIYLPLAFVDSIEATNNDYKNIFNSSSAKTIYFLTADYDKAVEIQNKFIATNANQNFAKATLAEYDPDTNYLSDTYTLEKSIIVYNYSACDAFYDGVHSVSENYTIEYSGEMLLSDAIKAKHCDRCDYKEDATELAPLVDCLGYSSNGQGDIVQGFSVNIKVIGEYEAVLGTINYGVIAAADTREDKTQGADVFSLANKYSVDLTGTNFFEVKICGITEETADTYLFFCAYLTIGEDCYYVSNDAVGKTAASTTYNLSK